MSCPTVGSGESYDKRLTVESFYLSFLIAGCASLIDNLNLLDLIIMIINCV